MRYARNWRRFYNHASGSSTSNERPGLAARESISPSMGDVNNVTGALPTALSDWSATIGGTTAFINKSERIPATTIEETRRIIGWPLAREAAWVFFAELRSTSSGIAGSG